MSLSVFVNAVDRTSKWRYEGMTPGESRFERRPGGRGPGTFVFYDRSGASGFRPTTGQALVLKDAGTPIYTSQIVDVEEESLTGLDTGVQTTATTVDNQSYPGRQVYTITYPAGSVTLKQILQDLVAGPLAPFGVTLDAGQATGATSFDELNYDGTVESILNDLQTRTGWPWRITPANVLSMVAPATESSGISLNDSTPTVQGVVSLRKSRSSTYGNTIRLVCGPTGNFLAQQRWTADGVATSWVTDIAAAEPAPGLVMVDDGVTPFMATVGPGAMFNWNTATHTLSVGTYGTPTAGVELVLGPKTADGDAFDVDGYTAIYPFTVTVEDAGVVATEKPYVLSVRREDLKVFDAAVSYALALLDQALAEPWIITVAHRAGLAWPGQTISLSFAEHQISGTYMILSVAADTDVDGTLIYTNECLSGDVLQRTWVDYFRDLQGGGAASIAASGGTTTVTTLALSAPFSLGGSRDRSQPVGTVSTPVLDWQKFVAKADGTVILRVTTRCRTAGPTVTPEFRKWNSGGSTWDLLVSGAANAGTGETDQEFSAAVVAGGWYRLQYKTNNASGSAYCIGQVDTP